MFLHVQARYSVYDANGQIIEGEFLTSNWQYFMPVGDIDPAPIDVMNWVNAKRDEIEHI